MTSGSANCGISSRRAAASGPVPSVLTRHSISPARVVYGLRVAAEELTVASLNTRGIPLPGGRLARRYAAIGAGLEAGDADVVCFQEVLTWWHLRLLAKAMPSFGQVCYRALPYGPAGGLATFSRLPVPGMVYRAFGLPPRVRGLPMRTRLQMGIKGALITRLAEPGVWVVNTHPASNSDGDWSPASRFYPMHRAQLDALTRALHGADGPLVVCGDFNIDRDSSLFGDFVTGARLADAFGGTCPPTFRAEYLPAGETPRCIDFILTTSTVTITATALLFVGKQTLPGGPCFLSDHIGLSATLSL
jgi:endonuclease/exonuclease/phosphatase (EEP) superfamily protein YafD